MRYRRLQSLFHDRSIVLGFLLIALVVSVLLLALRQACLRVLRSHSNRFFYGSYHVRSSNRDLCRGGFTNNTCQQSPISKTRPDRDMMVNRSDMISNTTRSKSDRRRILWRKSGLLLLPGLEIPITTTHQVWLWTANS